MSSADTTSHPSLSGLYVKAQELDRGHAQAPAWKLAPPGSSANDASPHSNSHASAHASSHASSNDPNAHNDGSSPGFSLVYSETQSSYTLTFHCFDTPNSIVAYGFDATDSAFEHALLDMRAFCMRIHNLWSFSMPGSDVARMNKRATNIDIDEQTARLLEKMKEFHAIEPLFDFTIGPASFLWKHARHLPSDERISAALSHVGAELVSIQGNTVFKDDERAKIDVGAAAKGFVADILANEMRKAGATSAEINLGGNLYMIGSHPSGRPWHVDIRIPDNAATAPIVLEVCNKSVVTSGSYERFVTIDGKRYQHIIDPRTGWPSTSDIISATVISSSSLTADMLATATCIAGSEEFKALADRHSDCEIIAIRDTGEVLRSR